jgi:dethiobiotin synthetase
MPDKQPIFISGIDTGIGKTLVSAILTEKLNADYWKPIQSGDLDSSDTLKVKSLISNKVTHFFSGGLCAYAAFLTSQIGCS